MLVMQAEASIPKPVPKRVPLFKVVRKLAETGGTAPPAKKSKADSLAAKTAGTATAEIKQGGSGSEGDAGLSALMGGYASGSDN